MKDISFWGYLKRNFRTFFLWYPLLTLVLLPILFLVYGGSLNNFIETFTRLMTWQNVLKYLGVLIISYLGHVMYGWLRNKELNRMN